VQERSSDICLWRHARRCCRREIDIIEVFVAARIGQWRGGRRASWRLDESRCLGQRYLGRWSLLGRRIKCRCPHHRVQVACHAEVRVCTPRSASARSASIALTPQMGDSLSERRQQQSAKQGPRTRRQSCRLLRGRQAGAMLVAAEDKTRLPW